MTNNPVETTENTPSEAPKDKDFICHNIEMTAEELAAWGASECDCGRTTRAHCMVNNCTSYNYNDLY